MSLPRNFTREEVLAESSLSRVLFILHDKVYDATAYLKDHPGGADIIAAHAGLDATSDFFGVGHSSKALALLAPLQVGLLVPSPFPPAPRPAPPPLLVILDKCDVAIETAALARAMPGCRVVALDLRTQDAALAHPLLPQADAVMVWHTLLVDTALIARMPRARVIVRVGVGYDNIDLRAAAEVGLPVANVPNYGTEEVADHAMSLLLNLLRRTSWCEARAKEGEAAHGSDGVAVLAAGTRRLRGLTLGLVGCGQIGTAMALRGKVFGLDVVFYDPHAPAGLNKALGIRRAATIEELAAQSHILSCHCDLNPTSRGIVNAALLRAMPRGSYVINTARGGIVDEVALRSALEEGHIAGAGIDVHEKEPFVGTDPTQPLAGAPHCISTPHTAFFSEESYKEIRELASGTAAMALLGKPIPNVVNARLLEGGSLRAAIVEPR